MPPPARSERNLRNRSKPIRFTVPTVRRMPERKSSSASRHRRSWAEPMWVLAYIAAIVGLNWLFEAVPPVETPFGAVPLATLIVGAVFVLRDYAQRQIGHYILLATLVAGMLTWFMVNPKLAVASTTA